MIRQEIHPHEQENGPGPDHQEGGDEIDRGQEYGGEQQAFDVVRGQRQRRDGRQQHVGLDTRRGERLDHIVERGVEVCLLENLIVEQCVQRDDGDNNKVAKPRHQRLEVYHSKAVQTEKDQIDPVIIVGPGGDGQCLIDDEQVGVGPEQRLGHGGRGGRQQWRRLWAGGLEQWRGWSGAVVDESGPDVFVGQSARVHGPRLGVGAGMGPALGRSLAGGGRWGHAGGRDGATRRFFGHGDGNLG